MLAFYDVNGRKMVFYMFFSELLGSVAPQGPSEAQMSSIPPPAVASSELVSHGMEAQTSIVQDTLQQRYSVSANFCLHVQIEC